MKVEEFPNDWLCIELEFLEAEEVVFIEEEEATGLLCPCPSPLPLPLPLDRFNFNDPLLLPP